MNQSIILKSIENIVIIEAGQLFISHNQKTDLLSQPSSTIYIYIHILKIGALLALVPTQQCVVFCRAIIIFIIAIIIVKIKRSAKICDR